MGVIKMSEGVRDVSTYIIFFDVLHHLPWMVHVFR